MATAIFIGSMMIHDAILKHGGKETDVYDRYEKFLGTCLVLFVTYDFWSLF